MLRRAWRARSDDRSLYAFVYAGVRTDFLEALAVIEEGRDIQTDLGVPPWVGLAVLRPLYKPNRTVNVAYRCWEQTKTATERPPAELLEPAPSGPACELPWHEWLLNPIGTILMAIARPDLSRYATRLHDLNGAITLVNLKREIRHASIDEDAVSDFLSAQASRFADPYTGKPIRWNADSGALEFASPNLHLGFNALHLSALPD